MRRIARRLCRYLADIDEHFANGLKKCRQLMVHGPNGGSGIRVFDRLVFTPKAFWKIDSFRVATGEKLVEGQTVSLDSGDCIDRTGKLWLKIEKYEGREHNKVGEYIDPASEKPPPAKKETLAEELRRKGADSDDDIPI